MTTLGSALLIAAALGCGYAVAAGLIGTRGDRRWVDSARLGVYAVCGLLTAAVALLQVAFVRSDFSFQLVADHSSTTTPTFYKLTAMWSSQGGSLLLWVWVLSIAAAAVLYLTRRRHREIVPWATAVLAGIGLFFTGLMLIAGGANPFATASPAPVEGVGLMPLLRHPAMAIHPPMLYSGYVLFSIPFAFAIGALAARRVDASWIRTTRRFALLAWVFLSIGILLGARWSYGELGWGGYWAWDPVENASLMPWLTGTAFLHSIMVQERRGMLRVWNVSLICATFALALLGTFLVRSGILDSIHAFGASTVGGPLLALIAITVVGSAALIASRLDELRGERRVESLVSREAVFLVNNLLLVGLCAVIFWGTFFPLISEAVTGERSVLGPTWFDRYTAPLAILLVLFTGIGPLLAWRRVSAGAIWRIVRAPVALAAVATAAIALLTDAASEPPALALFAFAAFALAAVGQEFVRGGAAQRRVGGGSWIGSVGRVVARNRRRYGGYVVHAGVAIVLVAVAASSSFQTSRDLRLAPGESATVGDYELTYASPTARADGDEQKLSFGAVLAVERDGEPFATLRPSREYYSLGSGGSGAGPVRAFFEGEATTEVGRQEGLTSDLWTAMQPDLEPLDGMIAGADRRLERIAERIDPTDEAALAQLRGLQGVAVGAIAERYLAEGLPIDLRVNVNPLVMWIWLGAGIAVAGALLAIWPAPGARRRRVSDVYAARLARDLERV
ncbi:MAG TPA: heme lyase CcmF/NrfE family subunit [Solirubrobacterales bacterium]|nr:heme lyase CcmF/NrfE family subunit [Solirubrobacterales bacterium]